jgi:phosphatidylserine/phosphatidylglycerophosphate/cardiolipin synthase-like enzyme
MSPIESFIGALVILGVGVAIAANYEDAPRDRIAEADPVPSISVCFSPEGKCVEIIRREIAYAEHHIMVHAYSFTTSTGIVDALIAAKTRGVQVEVIADRSTPCGLATAVPLLVNAAIPVWIDYQVPIAHEKAIVIDGQTVVEGSYNWTGQAVHNSEDLNVIRSPLVAAQYERHWRERRAAATPIGEKVWCIAGRRAVAQ